MSVSKKCSKLIQYTSNYFYFRQYYSTFQDAFGCPWRGVWWVSWWLGVWTGWWTMLQRSRSPWWPTTVNMYTTSSTNMQLDSSSVNYSIWSSPLVRWNMFVFWFSWSKVTEDFFRFLWPMPFWIINILIMVIWFTNTTGKKWLMDIDMNQIFNSFSYFSLDSETRSLRETFNPMCEVFPNVRNSKSCWFSFIT